MGVNLPNAKVFFFFFSSWFVTYCLCRFVSHLVLVKNDLSNITYVEHCSIDNAVLILDFFFFWSHV